MLIIDKISSKTVDVHKQVLRVCCMKIVIAASSRSIIGWVACNLGLMSYLYSISTPDGLQAKSLEILMVCLE